jgi:hypothetical protein
MENQEQNSVTETELKQNQAGTGVADQQPDVAAESVNQQGENAQVANEQQVQEIPLHLQPRHKEIIEKKEREIADARKRAEDAERSALLLQQQILAAQNMSQQNQQQPNTIQGYLSQMGLKPDDVPTVEAIQNAMAAMQRDNAILMQTQQFLARRPDFNDKVGRINPVTRQVETSEYLKKVINQNPDLRGLEVSAMNNPAMAAVAYQIADSERKITELEQQIAALNEKTGAVDEFAKQEKIRNKTGVVSGQAVSGGASSSIEQEIQKLNPNDPNDVIKLNRLVNQIKTGQFDSSQ